MTHWIEVKVTIDRPAADIIATFLQEKGGQGAVLNDPQDIKEIKELDYIVWKAEVQPTLAADQVQVVSYFDEQADIEELEFEIDEKIDQLQALGLSSAAVQIEIEEVDDSHWYDEFEKHYQAISVSRYLKILPAKDKAVKKLESNPQPIILDPGLAFGSGQHPTTLLALLALEYSLQQGESVLDLGSGSGILAIAAARLDARTVDACDIDLQAIESSRQNLELNQLKAQVFQSDLFDQVSSNYDIIVANIVAKYVIKVLEQADKYLNVQGRLILSGILEEKNQAVLEAIEANHFAIDLKLQKEDWLAYVLKRKEQ